MSAASAGRNRPDRDRPDGERSDGERSNGERSGGGRSGGERSNGGRTGGRRSGGGRLGRAIEWLARTTAVLGGVVLSLLVLLTCLSVLGRGLNTFGHSDFLEGRFPELARALLDTGVKPILGDFELVEAGIAFAVFCFLPICQLHGAHASVDIATRFLPPVVQRLVAAFWEVVLSGVILLIAWRLYAGLEGKLRNGETTFLLQFPVWWAYAASFAAALVACVVALYVAFARVRAVPGEGAGVDRDVGASATRDGRNGAAR